MEWVKNNDIIKGLWSEKNGQKIVGFAAEAENFVQNAKQKLIQKDWTGSP